MRFLVFYLGGRAGVGVLGWEMRFESREVRWRE